VIKVAVPPPAPKPTKKVLNESPNTDTSGHTPESQQNGDVTQVSDSLNFETANKDISVETNFLLPTPTISLPPITEDLSTPPTDNDQRNEEELPLPSPPLTEKIEQSLTLSEDSPVPRSPTQTESLTNTITASENSSDTISELSRDHPSSETYPSLSSNDIVAINTSVTSSLSLPKVRLVYSCDRSRKIF